MAAVHGAVLDVLAGDVVAQAPGDYALTSYLAERSSTGPYKAGALAGNARTSADLGAVRLTSYGEVAGMTWAWSVMTQRASAKLAAGTMPVTFGRNAEGTADLRLSATLWPVHSP